MAVAQHATGVWSGPPITTREVENDRANRVSALCRHDALLGIRMSLRFFGSIKTRPHQHAFGTEYHRSCHATPVGNSARGNHGGAGAEIDHPRQQGDQRLYLTMPPSLSAL